MKKIIAWASGLGLIGTVVFLVVSSVTIFVPLAFFLTVVQGIFGAESSTTVTSSPPILQSVQQIGQLATTRAQYASADININRRFGAGNICSITAHHTTRAIIEAGIDLQHLTNDDIKFNAQKNEYTITLPPPALTNCIIDPINTRQYHVSGEWLACGENRDDLRRVASYEAIMKFRNEAIEDGILQQTQRDTELLLSSLIGAIGNGATVNLQFSESDAIDYPPTCRPSPPEPWVFDEENNRWKKD